MGVGAQVLPAGAVGASVKTYLRKGRKGWRERGRGNKRSEK